MSHLDPELGPQASGVLFLFSHKSATMILQAPNPKLKPRSLGGLILIYHWSPATSIRAPRSSKIQWFRNPQPINSIAAPQKTGDQHWGGSTTLFLFATPWEGWISQVLAIKAATLAFKAKYGKGVGLQNWLTMALRPWMFQPSPKGN